MIGSMGRGALAAGLAVAVVGLVACQPAGDGASAAASESATAAGPSEGASASAASGVETSVFDLETGDCFSLTSLESVENVTVVPCAEPHIYEVFAVLEHPGGGDDPFPGDDEMISYADDACRGPFEEYVGRDYESSDFYITSVNPSAATWSGGDREIICALNLEDESDVTGTAEGSGR